jgi:hypothetical protein
MTKLPKDDLSLLAAYARRLERERAMLADALRAIYDEQNGPPLLTRSDDWATAMEKARQALALVEAGQ